MVNGSKDYSIHYVIERSFETIVKKSILLDSTDIEIKSR